MRLSLSVSAPTWTANTSSHVEQYRLNAIGKVLRDIADRLQNGGGGTGDVTFEREGLSATYRMEKTPAVDAAA
jgi:hypothetical protein